MVELSPGMDSGLPERFVSEELRTSIMEAVWKLEAWLESQRQPGGYGGPVVHWWADCLDYTGPGLDWRYEGIICGYLNLYSWSMEPKWLAKACRAGDDLVAGQLPSGNYRNSQFELNPGMGGTPHEAACDAALLQLALALKAEGNERWSIYANSAMRNLQDFYIERLWDNTNQCFSDQAGVASFVPNKAATLVEALLLAAQLTAESKWSEQYARLTLNKITRYQVVGGELDGAIYQNSLGGRIIERFFPFYIARCLPALLQGYQVFQEEAYRTAACRAANFIIKTRYPDGSFPQVLYRRGRVNRYPQWVAGAGDILRCLALAAEWAPFDPAPTLAWLLGQQKPDGSLPTAVGFGNTSIVRQKPDARDELGVCGWVDKTFRYLTTLVG